MAPARANSDDSRYSPPTLEEIIFSCGICQATVSELYPSNADNSHSHSSGDDDGMGTRLWIANCVHIFCGRHLEGGGVPFHSSSGPPQAICPVCVRTEDNHEVRNLYGIRGLSEGKLDSAIPAVYAKCPPVSLDGNDPGAEALRFQYSRLKTYSQEVTRRWKSAERKKRTVENTLHNERKQLRSLEAAHEELKARHAEVTKKLQGWEDRKDKIKHYMGAVGEMARDVQTMRSKLAKLGYHVEHKTYGLEAQSSSHSKRQPLLESTRGNSSVTLVEDCHGGSSSKRKRGDYDPYPDDKDVELELARDRNNDMPPPPAPASRIQPQTRPSAMAQTRVDATQSPPPHRHAKPLQSEAHYSQGTQSHIGSGWHNGDLTIPMRQPAIPVPAMRSMNLHSGTSPYHPQRGGAAVSSQRVVAVEEQQFDPRDLPTEWPTQPSRPQMGDMYSQSGTGRPPRYFERPHADVVEVDTFQEGHSQPLEAYVDHSWGYERADQPWMLVPSPSRAIASVREPNIYGTYSQPLSSPQPRPAEQPDSSVLSPFFKSNNAKGTTGQMPPPSVRGADRRRMEFPPGESFASSRVNRPEPSQHSSVPGRDLADGSFSTPYAARHDLRAHEDQPASQRFGSAVQHRRYDNTRASQMHSQPTYSHPAQAMRPLAQAESPTVQPYRVGRMTLPSSTSSRRGLDPQVSQIRGVRGAGPSSLSSQYARQGAASSYSARGSTYSQLGSRSIVRR